MPHLTRPHTCTSFTHTHYTYIVIRPSSIERYFRSISAGFRNRSSDRDRRASVPSCLEGGEVRLWCLGRSCSLRTDTTTLNPVIEELLVKTHERASQRFRAH